MHIDSRSFEPALRGPLQIGAWQVDPDLNEIRRGPEIVRLEPKAMAVLVYLAGRPGEVASRDELLAAVWPGVIVGDNALTQVIIKLRKALGDTARKPAYIQAISKKGYRLIAPVGPRPATPPPRAAGAGAAPRSQRSQHCSRTPSNAASFAPLRNWCRR